MSEELKKKEVGFTSYLWNGVRLVPTCHLDDAKMYLIDSTKMVFPEWNPDKHVIKLSRWQKVKRYFENLWLALKGYNFNDD